MWRVKSYSKLVNKTPEADSESREPTSGEERGSAEGTQGVGKSSLGDYMKSCVGLI